MSETNELAERIARAVTAHMTEEQAGDVDLYDGYLTERLIPVITRQLATAQWQPLSTAPRDNSYILIWSGCWRHPFAGRYLGDSKVLIDGADIDATQTEYFATHWMPLPAPPDAAQPLHWPFTARHANCADCDREYESPPAAQPVAGGSEACSHLRQSGGDPIVSQCLDCGASLRKRGCPTCGADLQCCPECKTEYVDGSGYCVTCDTFTGPSDLGLRRAATSPAVTPAEEADAPCSRCARLTATLEARAAEELKMLAEVQGREGSMAKSLTEFVCIDEDEAVAVFDYLSGADDNVDKELIAVHLQLCFDCQEAVEALLSLNPAARQRLAVLKEEKWRCNRTGLGMLRAN